MQLSLYPGRAGHLSSGWADAIVQLVHNVLAAFQADLETGALVLVKGRKTTCHRLPVGGPD